VDGRAFDLLSLNQVADLLHCSKAHVSKVCAGKVPDCSPIPSIRLGRRLLVRRSSLLEWIAANETGKIAERQQRLAER
jgi:hypothetical protein